MAHPPVFILVVGGSASGKSLFALELKRALDPAAAVEIVAEDSYYHSLDGHPPEAIAAYNFDEPAAKDFALLIDHLRAARERQAFDSPSYDFATHLRTPEPTRVEPADVVIVEGMHCAGHAALREIAALTVFVEADVEVRLSRRLKRDTRERGRTPESVRAQFASAVEPMHQEHVEPLKAHADHVVVNATDDAGALREEARSLAARIRGMLGG
jgi:uridine kinase